MRKRKVIFNNIIHTYSKAYEVKSIFFGGARARACFPDKTVLKSAERRPAKARSLRAGSGALPRKILKNGLSETRFPSISGAF